MTITNYEENNFVAALANNFSWIGAQWNDSMSDYLWVDGSDIGFTDRWINKRWKNSSCVGICASSEQLCSDVGAWHQDKCVHLKPFVCEREGKGVKHYAAGIIYTKTATPSLKLLLNWAVVLRTYKG